MILREEKNPNLIEFRGNVSFSELYFHCQMLDLKGIYLDIHLYCARIDKNMSDFILLCLSSP